VKPNLSFAAALRGQAEIQLQQEAAEIGQRIGSGGMGSVAGASVSILVARRGSRSSWSGLALLELGQLFSLVSGLLPQWIVVSCCGPPGSRLLGSAVLPGC
jgi:hypothetical protein